MSHTFKSDNTIFHYNPDLSGDVTISVTKGPGQVTFHVPGDALKEFMGEWLRNQFVNAFDDLPDDEMFALMGMMLTTKQG